jgi:hypothetical protein
VLHDGVDKRRLAFRVGLEIGRVPGRPRGVQVGMPSGEGDDAAQCLSKGDAAIQRSLIATTMCR